MSVWDKDRERKEEREERKDKYNSHQTEQRSQAKKRCAQKADKQTVGKDVMGDRTN